jgi:hypothetical protein
MSFPGVLKSSQYRVEMRQHLGNILVEVDDAAKEFCLPPRTQASRFPCATLGATLDTPFQLLQPPGNRVLRLPLAQKALMGSHMPL